MRCCTQDQPIVLQSTIIIEANASNTTILRWSWAKNAKRVQPLRNAVALLMAVKLALRKKKINHDDVPLLCERCWPGNLATGCKYCKIPMPSSGKFQREMK